MSMNPAKALRSRMAGAIDWRVDRAFDQRSPVHLPDDARQQLDVLQDRVDRNSDDIAALRVLLTEISFSLSDQNRELGNMVEQLDRRIATLER